MVDILIVIAYILHEIQSNAQQHDMLLSQLSAQILGIIIQITMDTMNTKIALKQCPSKRRSGPGSCTIHRLLNPAPLPVSGGTAKFDHRCSVISKTSLQGRQMNKRD
ncbi:Hypothetical_protein [Hexamita inflata]|uniref:Hypothetical_protein n=1 Tax=Hexamita inflata TaxID=28002 RepID=A0AA86Q8I1_9EUKA|nr:Hypothetical protein HINF_LOCUS39072 [Hexamita inflata]CAI9951429.1 Hypothetical protein HINF_LOCUS39074 [Hexamita inflata]